MNTPITKGTHHIFVCRVRGEYAHYAIVGAIIVLYCLFANARQVYATPSTSKEKLL